MCLAWSRGRPNTFLTTTLSGTYTCIVTVEPGSTLVPEVVTTLLTVPTLPGPVEHPSTTSNLRPSFVKLCRAVSTFCPSTACMVTFLLLVSQNTMPRTITTSRIKATGMIQYGFGGGGSTFTSSDVTVGPSVKSSFGFVAEAASNLKPYLPGGTSGGGSMVTAN